MCHREITSLTLSLNENYWLPWPTFAFEAVLTAWKIYIFPSFIPQLFLQKYFSFCKFKPKKLKYLHEGNLRLSSSSYFQADSCQAVHGVDLSFWESHERKSQEIWGPFKGFIADLHGGGGGRPETTKLSNFNATNLI